MATLRRVEFDPFAVSSEDEEAAVSAAAPAALQEGVQLRRVEFDPFAGDGASMAGGEAKVSLRRVEQDPFADAAPVAQGTWRPGALDADGVGGSVVDGMATRTTRRFERAARAVGAGTASVVGGVLKAPEGVLRGYEAAGDLGGRIAGRLLGLSKDEVEAQAAARRAAGSVGLVPGIVRGLSKAADVAFDEGRRLSQSKTYDAGIVEDLKQAVDGGDWGRVGRHLGLALAENLPQVGIVAASSLRGDPQSGLRLIATMAGGQKLEELDRSQVGMDEGLKLLNAAGTGVAEGLFEGVSAKLWGRVAAALQKSPVAREGVKQGLARAFGRVARNAGLGSGEEAGTQIADNAINIMTGVRGAGGVRPGLLDGVADAALLGGVLESGTAVAELAARGLQPTAAAVEGIEEQARMAFGSGAQVSQVENGRTVRVAHGDGSVHLLRLVDEPTKPTDVAGFVRSIEARPGGKESVARAREASGGREQALADALWEEWRPTGSTRVEPELVDPETGRGVGAGVVVELVAGEATRGTVTEEITHLMAILSGNRVANGRVVDPSTGQALDEESVADALADGVDHPVLSRMRRWALQLVGMFRQDRTEPLFWTARRLMDSWQGQVQGPGQTAVRRAPASSLSAEERADLAERAAQAAARFDPRTVDVVAEEADPIIVVPGRATPRPDAVVLENRVREAERLLAERAGEGIGGPVVTAEDARRRPAAGEVVGGPVTAGPDRTLVTGQIVGGQVVAAPRVQRALFNAQGRVLEGTREEGKNGASGGLPPPAPVIVRPDGSEAAGSGNVQTVLEGAANPPPDAAAPGSSPGAAGAGVAAAVVVGGNGGSVGKKLRLNTGIRSTPKQIMGMKLAELRAAARVARYPESNQTVLQLAGGKSKDELRQALLEHRRWYMAAEGRAERKPVSREARAKMSAAARRRMDGAQDLYYADMEADHSALLDSRAQEGRLFGTGTRVVVDGDSDASEADWVVDHVGVEGRGAGTRLVYFLRDEVSGDLREVRNEWAVTPVEGGDYDAEFGEGAGADDFGPAGGGEDVANRGGAAGDAGVEQGESGAAEAGAGGIVGTIGGAGGDAGLSALLEGTKGRRQTVRGETRVAQRAPEALLGELRGAIQAGEAERAQGKLAFQVRRRGGRGGARIAAEVGPDGQRLHSAAARVDGMPGAEGAGVAARPGSWYRPDATSAWVREQEAAASDAALREMLQASRGRVEDGEVDHGAAAAAILLNRAAARRVAALERAAAARQAGQDGDEAAARAEAAAAGEELGRVTDELNRLNVHAGRIIQQNRYLRNAAPVAMVELMRRGLARQGLTLTTEQAERLEVVMGRDHEASQAVIEAANAYARAPGAGTARALDGAVEAAAAAHRENQRALRVLPRTTSGMLVSMMQMGLLDTVSIGKNTIGNMLFAPVRAGVNVVAAAADWGLAALSGGRLERQYLSGLGDLGTLGQSLPKAARAAGEALRTGEAAIRPGGEGRDQRPFRPLEAWRELFSGENIARVARANGDTRPSVRAITERVLEGTFGNYTALMQRLLLATDLPFWVISREMALSNIGRERGLAGQQLAAFVAAPPADAVRGAEERAAVAVFQGQGAVSELSQAAARFGRGIPLVGGAVNLAARAVVPFVQTPSNIAGQALQMFAFPASIPAGVAVAAWGRVKGDRAAYRQGLELAGRGVVGFAMISLAGALGGLGVLFGRPDDERRRAAQEATTGTNRLNVSGMERALEVLKAGGDREDAAAAGAWRDGDRTVTFAALGFPGLAMSVMANGRDSYEQALNSDSLRVRDAASLVGALAGQTLKATLDLPLLQGIGELADAIRGERKWERFVARWMATVSSAFVPRAGKALTEAQQSWLLETRSVNWKEEFVSEAWRQRVWPLAQDLPLKRDYFGRRIRAVPEGANPWMARLGDALQTRQVRGGDVDGWLARRYAETGEVEFFPAIPVRTLEFAWPEKNVAAAAGVQQMQFVLRPAEHERMLKRVGVLRYKALQGLVGGERFRALPAEAQLRVIGRVYRETLEIGKRMAVEDRGVVRVNTGQYRRILEGYREW